jgi:LysR family transcriptional regulator, regulator for bpeEF and oprC
VDRLDAMKTFARLVEAGSFRKTADSLGIQAAAVTRAIQQLEAHLRIVLVNRSTRKVSITAEGMQYYERLRDVLSAVDELEGEVGAARGHPRGDLRVHVPPLGGQNFIIPALSGFFAQYPDVRLDLRFSDRPVDLNAEGVDCVVRVGDIRDEGLVAIRIGSITLGTYASPAYLARNGEPRTPGDLEAHYVVNGTSVDTGRSTPFVFNKGGDRIEIHGRHLVSVNDTRASIASGIAGLGLIQVPGVLVREHVQSGELTEVLCNYRRDSMPVHVAYLPNRKRSAKVKAFVNWTVALFSEMASLAQQWDAEETELCWSKHGATASAQTTAAASQPGARQRGDQPAQEPSA